MGPKTAVMIEPLFRDDGYSRAAPGVVTAHSHRGGVVLSASLFHPIGGGPPGDSGALRWAGGEMAVAATVKAERGKIAVVPAEGAGLPPIGAAVQVLDWERRHRLMCMHTALNLLPVVLPFPVIRGSLGTGKGRLDFAMKHPPEDRAVLEGALNAVIARDLAVSAEWITDEGLDANRGRSEQCPSSRRKAPDKSGASRSPALRRHAGRAHWRDRPGGARQGRNEGQAEPAGPCASGRWMR